MPLTGRSSRQSPPRPREAVGLRLPRPPGSIRGARCQGGRPGRARRVHPRAVMAEADPHRPTTRVSTSLAEPAGPRPPQLSRGRPRGHSDFRPRLTSGSRLPAAPARRWGRGAARGRACMTSHPTRGGTRLLCFRGGAGSRSGGGGGGPELREGGGRRGAPEPEPKSQRR